MVKLNYVAARRQQVGKFGNVSGGWVSLNNCICRPQTWTSHICFWLNTPRTHPKVCVLLWPLMPPSVPPHGVWVQSDYCLSINHTLPVSTGSERGSPSRHTWAFSPVHEELWVKWKKTDWGVVLYTLWMPLFAPKLNLLVLCKPEGSYTACITHTAKLL